jgi:leucyl aminopeptidase
LDIQVNFTKQHVPSGVLIVDYFENCPPEFGNRFPSKHPFYDIVRPAFETGDFTGKWKQNLVLYTYGKMPETRIMLVGMGNKDEISPFQIKVIFGSALRRLQHMNLNEVSTFVDKKCCQDDVRKVVEFLVEAAYLAQYRHPSFKKINAAAQDFRMFEKINLIVPEDAEESVIRGGISEGAAIGSIVNEVRDLVNKPSNYVTPAYLANCARMIARNFPSIQCTIFDRDQIASMGMGGIIGVSKGSKEPPYLVQSIYTPETTTNDMRTIALVGKGITFDAGGISIKPSEGMYRMKDDMAGAALALGITKLAAMLKLPVKIIAISPVCENMPSGEALKPGDIITAFDGSSVEIYDTDAEGRLILMDALAYATTFKPNLIVDMATLTGACTIALGRYCIGGFTNHQPAMDLLKASGDYIYERVWQMPLMAEYKLQLKSLFADIRNHGGREAGAVTAAVFLNHFVGKTPWIHLDIAGVTWFDTETSLIPEGASGIGVRLMIDFLHRICEEPHSEIWQQEAKLLEEPTAKQNEVPMGDSPRYPRQKYFS